MAIPEPDPYEDDYNTDEDYDEPIDYVDYGQTPEFEVKESQTKVGLEGGKVTIPCQLTSDCKYDMSWTGVVSGYVGGMTGGVAGVDVMVPVAGVVVITVAG